jgi:hypothetical protein
MPTIWPCFSLSHTATSAVAVKSQFAPTETVLTSSQPSTPASVCRCPSVEFSWSATETWLWIGGQLPGRRSDLFLISQLGPGGRPIVLVRELSAWE